MGEYLIFETKYDSLKEILIGAWLEHHAQNIHFEICLLNSDLDVTWIMNSYIFKK